MAVAGHQNSGVGQFTGCVVKSGAGAGTLVKLRTGASPKAACAANEQLVHVSGGDISSVVTAAAGGLQGGSGNGRVQLGLRPSFRLPQGCPTGRVPKWNGSAWLCAPDADTTYSAGDGLALEGTTFDVTGAPWEGLTGVPAGFADDRDDTPGRSTFTRTTVEPTVNPGEGTSIAIGTDGYGLIAFLGEATSELVVAHCTNTACTSFDTPTTVDSGASVGFYTSIAIGTDGFGLVSYHDATNGDLKVAHCTNTACTTFGTPTTATTRRGARASRVRRLSPRSARERRVRRSRSVRTGTG